MKVGKEMGKSHQILTRWRKLKMFKEVHTWINRGSFMTENLKVKGLSGIRKINNLSFHINRHGAFEVELIWNFKVQVMDALHLMECASFVPSYFPWDTFFFFFVWVLRQFSWVCLLHPILLFWLDIHSWKSSKSITILSIQRW